MSIEVDRSKAAELRNRLGFPVIDADGHQGPIEPGYEEYLRREGGSAVVDRVLSGERSPLTGAWHHATAKERHDGRLTRGAWWAGAHSTLDRATASLPKLLHERMDELGLDFTILYARGLFTLPYEPVEEIRRASIRAMNAFQADLYRECADRMTPVAAIPMQTPEEAVDAVVHAVVDCGLKVIAIPPGVLRPIAELHRRLPEAYPEASWWDTFGLDSEYDYDPFWKKCVELGVAVTAHGGVVPGAPWHGRSTSSYMANHLGTHAFQQSMLCKSLFLGGVTRRFPSLNFAFLEGGVGWACALYSDLIGHWEKRNKNVIRDLSPDRLDRAAYLKLVAQYGGPVLQGEPERALGALGSLGAPEPPDDQLDEWRHLEVTSAEELARLFTDGFYFGCEADDPTNAWAFNTQVNPFGARLKVVFSSDISHWDVPDMAAVLEEAYELVDRGVVSEDDFRDFVSTNPIRLHAGMNERFFAGTPVERTAVDVIGDWSRSPRTGVNR